MVKLKELLNEYITVGGLYTNKDKPPFQIGEGKELGGAMIEKIRLLTDRNNHTMARFELAKAAGSKSHMKFYSAVIDIQDVVGHLPMSLSKTRGEMEAEFMKLLKKKFSNFDIIHSVL
jgi:hypothetical protein